MVHVFCLDENCRRVLHLSDHEHWNYKGEVVCRRCGTKMEVEIDDGEVESSKKSEKE
jgi:hypothetical protein